ncbi:hypothetical protein JTB14_023531 [Gonioctena quinquepunctata]|nr:hypothetical protein JTB14_023531 [Gonioctena quinquepunctata]
MEKITCTRCPFPVELDVIEEYFTHYKSVHKYQCDICNKCLSSSYGYQYHMKHHEDIKKYKCPTEGCKKSFFLKNLLKKHLRLHTKSSVHQCDICGAVYKNMGALKYHKKTHEGLRNYLCTLCGNAFYQAVHLRDHMNRHTGNRKFICDICGKSFIIKAQLNKHIIFCTRRNARIKKEIQLKEEI